MDGDKPLEWVHEQNARTLKTLEAVPEFKSIHERNLVNQGVLCGTYDMVRRLQDGESIPLAEFLEGHPKVAKVVYPGLESHPQHELAKRQMRDFDGNFAPGTILYFLLEGDDPAEAKAKGGRFMDFLATEALTVTLAVSLGQIRTLVEHPASMTHAAVPAEEQPAAGIDPAGIRLSIGIEHPADVQADLERAFALI